MLLWLLDRYASIWVQGSFGSLEKITFRASLAAVASFLLAMLLGPRLIAYLKRRYREPIKCDSAAVAELHRHKQSTPTMGGLFIVATPSIAGGTTMILRSGFDPIQFARDIELYKGTLVFTLTTMWKMVVASGVLDSVDVSSVESVVGGGERTPLSLIQELHENPAVS